jgi:hypothetical protein
VSVLTKALVVLVSLAAVALSVLVAVNVQNQSGSRGDTESLRADKLRLENEVASARAQARSADDRVQKAVEASQNQIKGLSDRNAELSRQLADANAKMESMVIQNDTSKAEMARLAASNDQAIKTVTSLQTELNEARSALVKAEKTRIETDAAVMQSNSEKDLVSRQLAQLKQMLDAETLEKNDVQSLWAKVPDDIKQQIMQGNRGTTSPTAAPRVTGRVTRVTNVNNETWLQIDLGTKDKLAPQMTLVVSRGNLFLGRLVVSVVQDSEAAGRIVLKGQGEIQVGDIVSGG